MLERSKTRTTSRAADNGTFVRGSLCVRYSRKVSVGKGRAKSRSHIARVTKLSRAAENCKNWATHVHVLSTTSHERIRRESRVHVDSLVYSFRATFALLARPHQLRFRHDHSFV